MPRLSLLYPNFLRAVRSCEPQTYHSIRHPPSKRNQLHTTRHLSQEAYSSRYGPAANSTALPPPPKPNEPLYPDQPPSKPEKDHKEDPDSNPSHDEISHHIQRDGAETAYSAKEDTKQPPPPEQLEPLGNKELDTVLSVPSPSEAKSDHHHKHPHLEASPYEHHFDTYSLVQQLAAKDAYNGEQTVTLMKAIRLMLAINLDVAKDGLVSKSDTENEAYLFRAACSELRTTLQTTRHSEMLRQRGQRAQVQHESDLLNQKVTQDLMTMREELKGMFNDRKLGLQEEKRKIDGKIQELNYKITVLLNSEAKSNVESLRWVLTRRAALAICASACMILAALKLSSIEQKEREEAEKKRKRAKEKEKERQKMEAEGKFTVPSREMGTQTGAPTASYEESLG